MVYCKQLVLRIRSWWTNYLSLRYDGIFYEVLDQLGEMPLPPYIHEKLEDQRTISNSLCKRNGSAAAPTAGLHFTNEIIEKIREKGVEIVFITLHVGLEHSVQ